MKVKLAVIADDFTGSNDTGLQFAKMGLETGVIINPGTIDTALEELHVVVVDTESRFDSRETAFKKVYQITRRLTGKGLSLIYKKIDSTMRGNIGAEIDGAIEGTGAKAAIVVAAFPAVGRTTRNSICYVNGIPLEQTEVSNDPKSPVVSSHIPTIITMQSKRKVAGIHVEDVRKGCMETSGKIMNLLDDGAEIIVVDAVTDNDLSTISQTLPLVHEKVVLAGSAGFAEHIAESFYRSTPPEKGFRPILIVTGSMSEVTANQISYASGEKYIRVIDVNLQALFTGREEEEKRRIIKEANCLIAQKRDIVIRTAPPRKDGETARGSEAKKGLDSFKTSEHIGQFLGYITGEICSDVELKGLLLIGGDTAINVARMMNVSGTIIKDEVLPGIPCGYFISDTFGAMPVVTKAGAFGEKTAIVKIIDFLRRR